MPTEVPISFKEYQILEHNVVIIGWMGELLSSLALVASSLMLHYNRVVANFLWSLPIWEGADKETHLFLAHFVVIFSATCYAISLINIFASALLLIGILKRCNSLLFPWLLYHGFLFGVGVHFALYLTISGTLVTFELFVLAMLIFVFGIIVFFRIYHEVFMLYKIMDYGAVQSTLGGPLQSTATRGDTVV